MEAPLESLKSISRLKTLQASQVAQAYDAGNQLETYFDRKVNQERSYGESPRVNFVVTELQRVVQACQSSKPEIDPEVISAVNVLIARLRQLSQKALLVPQPPPPTTTANNGVALMGKQSSDMIEMTPIENGTIHQNGGDGTQPADPQNINNMNDAKDGSWTDSEVDSEEEYIRAREAERKKGMGKAALVLNGFTLLSLVIVILGCVGIGYTATEEFNTWKLQEKRNTLETIANFIVDGLTVIQQTGHSYKNSYGEGFTNDLRSLRIDGTSVMNPKVSAFFIDKKEPLMDVYARAFTYSDTTGEMLFAANVSRAFELMCLGGKSMHIELNNDLNSYISEPAKFIYARRCNVEAGGPIWKNTVSGRSTYEDNRLTYRGIRARQIGRLFPDMYLGITVGMEQETLQDVIEHAFVVTGSRNPLKQPWQQWSALWVSFIIVIALIAFVFIGEWAAWLCEEEQQDSMNMSPGIVAAVHILLHAVVIAAALIATGFVFWTYTEGESFALTAMYTEMIARTVAAGLASPSLLAPLGGSPIALVSLAATSSLGGQLAYVTALSTVPSSMHNTATELGLRAQQAAGTIYKTNQFYTSSSKKSRLTLSSFQMPLLPSKPVIAIFRTHASSKSTTGLLDAGPYGAAIIIGAFFGQLLFGALYYYLLTPLLALLSIAKGAIVLETLFAPQHYRQVLYVFMTCVSFATCLAIAFFAVHGMHEPMSKLSETFTDPAVLQAVAVAGGSDGGGLFVSRPDLLNKGMPSFAEVLAFQLSPADTKYGYPQLIPGQALRKPVPDDPMWESQNYAATISLMNRTTAFVAPAYDTPRASDYKGAVQGPSVYWKRLTTATVDAYTSVSLERSLVPEGNDPLMWGDYKIFISYIAASLLLCIIACLCFEFVYRILNNAVDPEYGDEDGEGLRWKIILYAILLLIAFAPLVGSGASESTLKHSFDHFFDSELKWGVAAIRPLVEGVASSAGLVGDSSILPAMLSLVDKMNKRTATSTKPWAHWVLLQEAAPFDGSLTNVRVVAGGDTSTPFALPNLNEAIERPITGVTAAKVFFNAEASRTVRYGAIYVNSFLRQGTTVQPMLYLALLADHEAYESAVQDIVLDVYRVSGAAVAVVFVGLVVLVWMTLDTASRDDYKLFDPSISLQGVAEVSECAPPTLPRVTRLWHTVVYIAIAIILIFYCVSMLFGSSMLVVAGHEFAVVRTQTSIARDQAYAALQPAVAFLISGFTSLQTAFEATTQTSTAKTLHDATHDTSFTFANATSGALVYKTFSSVASTISTFTSTIPATFFADEMVSNGYQTYQDATMSAKDDLNELGVAIDPVSTLLELFDAKMEQLRQQLQANGGTDLPSTTTFNVTAILDSITLCARAKEIMLSIFILEKVSLNSLIDYRQETQSNNNYMNELSHNATVYISQVNLAHTALISELTDLLTQAKVAIHDALSATNSKWATKALSILADVPSTLEVTSLFQSMEDSSTVWDWQGHRLAELASERYGDEATIASIVVPLRNALLEARSAVEVAVLGEEQVRLGQSGLYTATWKRSLYSFQQRISLLDSIDDILVTALAVTIVVLVLVVLVYAAASYLVTHSLIQHSAAQLLNAVVETDPNRDDDDSDNVSENSSLVAAGERHQQAHHRRIFISMALVLLLCVPIGMIAWTTRQGINEIRSHALSGSRSHEAMQLLAELESAGHEISYATTQFYAGGSYTTLSTAFDRYLNLYRNLEFLLREGLLLEDRKLVNLGLTGDNVAPADPDLYRAYVLRRSLDSIQAVMTVALRNMSAEIAMHTKFRSKVGNFSAASLPLQKIANNVLVKLLAVVNVTGPAVRNVLAPVASFADTATSPIAAQVAAMITDVETSIANNDGDATLITKLYDLQTLLSESTGIVEAEYTLWWLQTMGSNRNTTSSYPHYGRFAQLANVSATSAQLNAAAKTEIEDRYAGALGLLTPIDDALRLFNSTAVMTDYRDLNLTTPSEWLTAAGASSTYCKTTTSIADFRAIFAVNRGMTSTSALYPFGYAERMKASLTDLSDLVANMPLSQVRAMKTYTTPSSFGNVFRYEIVEAATPFGLQNAEYVHTVVQWVSIVCFWLLFASMAYFVVDVRLFTA